MTDPAPLGDPYSLGDFVDETPAERQMTADEWVYWHAHDEWLASDGREGGAGTLAGHIYLRIAAYVRRQAACELAAVADRRTGTVRSTLLMAGELITPDTPTRIVEQRRGTILAER